MIHSTYFWWTWAALPLLVATKAAVAVPASPEEHKLEQPDGSMILARQWGDEWLHGWETVSGYAIVFDTVSKTWFYAAHGDSGQLVASSTAAKAEASSHVFQKGNAFRPLYQSGREISRHLRPSGITKSSAMQKALPVSAGQPNQQLQAVRTTGIGKLPVLMINFSDTTTTYSAPDFDVLLFSGTDGYTLKDYYEEVSYKQFTLTGTISGWYTATKSHDYYGHNDSSGNDSFPGRLVEEAVTAADPSTDFSAYHTDGDCYVDVVAVIHQGNGEETRGSDSDIWSHRWSLNAARNWGAGGSGEYTTDDPCNIGGFIKVNDYILQPEKLHGGQHTIGVFAHEYGHSFGLPDLYDTDNSSNGVGRWALMAGGSWNKFSRPGDRPAHMSAWSKYFLGWVTPTIITGSLSAETVDAASMTADVYQAGSGSPAAESGEYFLIENRHKSGFDIGLRGSGLAIWHIDEARASSSNKDNANECSPPADCAINHYRVSLVQADNRWDLENKTNKGDVGDLYSGSAAGFSDSSSPSSVLYNGISSHFSATNISASATTMSADFSVVASINGVLSFGASKFAFDESAGSVSIPVTRTGGDSGSVSAHCQTTSISALADNDYSRSNINLTWAEGETNNKNCVVTILEDAIVEGLQHFQVTLSAPTGGAVLGAPSTAVIDIVDNETCSGNTVDLTGASFETGTEIECLATSSILAANGNTAAGSQVGFYSPVVSLGPDFSVNGRFSVGTYSVFDGANSTALALSENASDGPFLPYPSTIAVSGMSGTVSKVTVTLSNLEHTWPADMEILLLGPQGQSVLLLADIGRGKDIANIELVFDDEAGTAVPSPIVSGTYLPTSNGATSFTTPVPVGPYGSTMSALQGSDPNGDWKLYMFDDVADDTGSLNGGWSIHIETH